LYIYSVYICFVCISVEGAFLRTRKSTLQLRNALYNAVLNLLYSTYVFV